MPPYCLKASVFQSHLKSNPTPQRPSLPCTCHTHATQASFLISPAHPVYPPTEPLPPLFPQASWLPPQLRQRFLGEPSLRPAGTIICPRVPSPHSTSSPTGTASRRSLFLWFLCATICLPQFKWMFLGSRGLIYLGLCCPHSRNPP